MKQLFSASVLILFSVFSAFAEVQWTRLTGVVKGINGKTSQITIQNKEGDLLTVRVDPDVTIVKGKETILLKDVEMDQKVKLLFLPRAPTLLDDSPNEAGVYPPMRK